MAWFFYTYWKRLEEAENTEITDIKETTKDIVGIITYDNTTKKLVYISLESLLKSKRPLIEKDSIKKYNLLYPFKEGIPTYVELIPEKGLIAAIVSYPYREQPLNLTLYNTNVVLYNNEEIKLFMGLDKVKERITREVNLPMKKSKSISSLRISNLVKVNDMLYINDSTKIHLVDLNTLNLDTITPLKCFFWFVGLTGLRSTVREIESFYLQYNPKDKHFYTLASAVIDFKGKTYLCRNKSTDLSYWEEKFYIMAGLRPYAFDFLPDNSIIMPGFVKFREPKEYIEHELLREGIPFLYVQGSLNIDILNMHSIVVPHIYTIRIKDPIIAKNILKYNKLYNKIKVVEESDGSARVFFASMSMMGYVTLEKKENEWKIREVKLSPGLGGVARPVTKEEYEKVVKYLIEDFTQ